MATAGQATRGQGREALTEAAREVFAERGYDGASTREIARRAGLSLSALYYWHASKEDLLAALLLDSRHDYLQTCHRALAHADGPAERLGALVAATIHYRIRRQLESVITVREWRNLKAEHVEQLERLREAALGLWVGVVTDGVTDGVFACPAPDDARRSVEAACNAVAHWYDPGGDLTPDDLVERYTAIALRIVDHRPGGVPR